MQEKSLELLDQVLKIIESYNFALTLRQIYYQLVAKQIIPNQQKYYHQLSRLCVMGRNEGILPEEAFSDRLREVDRLSSWPDLNDFLSTVKRSYHKDKWENQDCYIEIWTEKDALRSVLTEVTYQYDVNLMVARGQLSRTEVYRTVERYKEKSDKECFLYYAGDFDPSGLSIFESIKERISNFGTDILVDIFPTNHDINFERIALTPEQIKKYQLPSDPAKQTDPNYKNFVKKYGDMVVEIDSLPPDELRNIVKSCIKRNIDYGLLAQVQEIEKEEQIKLDKFITGI